MSWKYVHSNDNKILTWNHQPIREWVVGPQPTWPTAGCLLAANFNNDLTDYYGHTASWNGSASYDADEFNGKPCVYFPIDSSNYVKFNNATDLQNAFTTTCSLSLWYKVLWTAGTGSSWSRLWSFGEGASVFGHPYGLYVNRRGSDMYWQVNVINDQYYYESKTFTTNVWMHSVWVLNKTGNAMQSYLNNVAAGGMTGKNFGVFDNAEFILGAAAHYNEFAKNVYIGPVRVYDHLLNTAEIDALYHEFD